MRKLCKITILQYGTSFPNDVLEGRTEFWLTPQERKQLRQALKELKNA